MFTLNVNSNTKVETSRYYISIPLFLTLLPPSLSSSLSLSLSLGTFPNLTSTGKASPGRIRTLKDQELMINEFKKENFGLKLRIYHLEEALRKQWGDKGDGWRMVNQCEK